MARPREINWSGSFEFHGEKVKGPGGGTHYSVDLSAFLSRGQYEKEVSVSAQGKRRVETARKAVEACLMETVLFLRKTRKGRAMSPQQFEMVHDRFYSLVEQEYSKFVQ